MNILLITSDQQRWDTLGCCNPKIKTPNLDRLASHGLLFDRAYTVNPVCTPTRVSILTGHYPSKHGCYTIGTSLNEDYPTVPAIMAKEGYFTALVGKAHFQACLNEPYPDKGTLESAPHIYDREYFRSWNGPYFGFDYVRLVIGHADQELSTGMHYGIWLEEQGIDTKKYFGNTRYDDFGTWDLPEKYSNSRWTADETIKTIDMAQDKGQPFFIWSSFQDPHNPCFVPEPWASMYDPADMPVYGLQDGELEGKPDLYEAAANGINFGRDVDCGDKNWHCVSNLPHMDEGRKREIMAKYYGMVSLMDHHIGRILDHLDKKGLLEDTLIVFTTDHGDYMGNHGLWWKGLPTYEDIHRIPFIVSHPGCKTKGDTSSALQSLVDLGTTFLCAAGIRLPAGIQGVNQERVWKGEAEYVRKWAMVEFRPSESPFMQKTFITNRYKLVVYHYRKYGELYDLLADPEQLVNLWDRSEYGEVKVLLLQELIFAEMEKDGELRERTAYA